MFQISIFAVRRIIRSATSTSDQTKRKKMVKYPFDASFLVHLCVSFGEHIHISSDCCGVDRCYTAMLDMPSVSLLLTKLCNEYSNVQTLVHLLLKWVIDSDVTFTVEGSKYLSLLNEILTSVELDSDIVDSISRFLFFD